MNMNTNFLRVFLLEPLQLLFYLIVIRALNLKLRFKLGCLRLKISYLTFQRRKLVFSKSKLLAEYCRRTVFVN